MTTAHHSNTTSHNPSRHALRLTLRKRRQALPGFRQYKSANQIYSVLQQCQEFKAAKRIASYLANDGEIDPKIIHQAAWQQGKQLFLPIPVANQCLKFAPYQRRSNLCSGQWGIKQPRYAKWIASSADLDLILVPLVAFDQYGNRLGRGGGYYDRFLKTLRFKSGTKVFGLAHPFQQVPQIPIEDWDMPLDGIVTTTKLIRRQAA